MNKDNVNKKYFIFGVLGMMLFLVLVIYFVIVYKNRNAAVYDNRDNGKTANEISQAYDNIDYGNASALSMATITNGGSYDLTGSYSCITVNTGEAVELNLTNATIACNGGPAINIIDADIVSIVINGTNTIKAMTTEKLGGAIYSSDDLVLAGSGSLNITSNYDGIVSKNTLVIKEGVYVIEAADDGIRGKDNVAIVMGSFNIKAGGDGIKATNEEDSEMGYVAIDGGVFNINSVIDGIQAATEIVIRGGTYDINTTDDGIHASGMVLIAGGSFNITAREGIEATYVKINDGILNIIATDDGINAGRKSINYSVAVEINGGNITITMGQGDTDGIDSNGNLYINGGTINITGNSSFDYDGEARYTGGTIIVNGNTVNAITNQMIGGKARGEVKRRG